MGRFQKGQSGNPNGRPKIAEEFRKRALKLVDEKVLTYWEDEITERQREIITPAGPMDMVCRGKEAMRASENIAAYALGKPIQPSESKIGVTVNDAREMTRAQLLAIAASKEAEAAGTEH